jgi:hypothetical protein
MKKMVINVILFVIKVAKYNQTTGSIDFHKEYLFTVTVLLSKLQKIKKIVQVICHE